MSSFAGAAGRFTPNADPRGSMQPPGEPDPGFPGTDSSARLQPLMLRLVCAIVAVLGCSYVAYFMAIGLFHAAAGCLACVAFAGLAVAFSRLTGRHQLALDALCVALFVLFAAVTLFQDGLRSPALCWLLALPLILLLAGSTIPGIVLGVGFIAQVAWLRSHPEPFTSLSLLATDSALQLALAMSLSALLVGLCAAFGWHWGRELRCAIERARALAEGALAAKSRFLSQVSHEIRTPLQGLIGATEMLDRPGLAPERRERLVEVQRQSADMLAALVNDVLDLSKLEAGKVRLEQRPTDLAALVGQVRDFFEPQAAAKGLGLTLSTSPDVPRLLLGDATRIRQIVGNLVSNAIKFTSHGSVHIHLALAGRGRDDLASVPRGMRVRIEVADSGIGIEASRMDLLFKPFHQADDTITRRFGGTGLGLSIADDLARLMNGHIEVSSAPGRGSTFAFVAPLHLPDGATASAVTPRRGRALVATATHDVSSHLKGLLEDLGIDSQIVSEVPDASAARQAGAGFVFLDSTLLQGPSDAAAHRLDELSASGVKVVVVSPFGSEPAVGVATFLVYTPVRRASLEALLDEPGASSPRGASAAAGDVGEAAAPPASEEPALRSGLVALLVEDDAANQAVIAAMLDFLKVTTVAAATGHDALGLLRARRFDVVLMDLHLPELDGCETTRLLRAHESSAGLDRTPVVAITGSTDVQTLQSCLAAGMDSTLAKPFGLFDLRRLLALATSRPAQDRRGTEP